MHSIPFLYKIYPKLVLDCSTKICVGYLYKIVCWTRNLTATISSSTLNNTIQDPANFALWFFRNDPTQKDVYTIQNYGDRFVYGMQQTSHKFGIVKSCDSTSQMFFAPQNGMYLVGGGNRTNAYLLYNLEPSKNVAVNIAYSLGFTALWRVTLVRG